MKLVKKIRHIGELIFVKLLPVKKNKYVFSSLNGHYSDSPKKISEELHKQNPEIEIVWLLNEQSRKDIPNYIKKVNIKSIEALYYRGIADVLIDNVYGKKATEQKKVFWINRLSFKFASKLRYKKKQKVYTTWHGTPLKCIGRDQIGVNVVDFSCPNTTMFLENEYSRKIISNLTFGKLNIVTLGCPRNDILFCLNAEEKEKHKKNLELPQDKRIVLFAPTFRSDGDGVSDRNIYRSGIDQLKSMNIEVLFDVLKRKFGNDWLFVCRFHYHVEKMVDWQTLEKQYPNQIINGNKFDDMAEYLACADVLITDVSSCMFDFSLIYKPCFLFFPDYDHYKNQERGFYMDIEELPFSLARSFDELIKNINSFNEETYRMHVDELHHKMGYIHEKEATKKIVKFILDENN